MKIVLRGALSMTGYRYAILHAPTDHATRITDGDTVANSFPNRKYKSNHNVDFVKFFTKFESCF